MGDSFQANYASSRQHFQLETISSRWGESLLRIFTGFSSEIGTKLRDWAVGQAGGSRYSQAALSSNDSKTLYLWIRLASLEPGGEKGITQPYFLLLSRLTKNGLSCLLFRMEASGGGGRKALGAF